jgi:hypothetical protein
MQTLRNTPAQSLQEVYLTLRSEPLTTEDELAAFYRAEMNAVRGGDKVQRLAKGLNQAHGITHFKAFFMGHQGVGKSTELSRLSVQMASKFRVIRFSAIDNLDPNNFRSLDLVLTMMIDITERISQSVEEGGVGRTPSKARLQEIWDWFATEKDIYAYEVATALAVEGGGGVKEDSLWNKVSSLFLQVKGSIKFAGNRKKEIIEYQINRLPSLLKIANHLLDDCNELLKEATGQEWLFIGEDFDKPGIPKDLIEDLFINRSNVFRELRCHMIFTLPLNLFYSSKATDLPFTLDRSFVLPDTPIFNQDHTANPAGRTAVADVLTARMSPNLFEKNQMESLIIASGGNLRDLFSLVNYATDTAELRGATKIADVDTETAVVNLRSAYQRRLGQSPYDVDTVKYADKAKKLLTIYNGDETAQIVDAVMYSLLSSKAVQEFNGKRWFGVHPLVVDILVSQKEIPKPKKGGVPGGTE